MVRQVLGESPHGVRSTAFGDEDHAALDRIRNHRDVVMSLGARGLVDRQTVQLRQIEPLRGQLDIALADRVHSMPGKTDQPGHGRKRHLAAKGHDQRLEEQGKPGELASPGRIDLHYTAVGEFDARHPYL